MVRDRVIRAQERLQAVGGRGGRGRRGGGRGGGGGGGGDGGGGGREGGEGGRGEGKGGPRTRSVRGWWQAANHLICIFLEPVYLTGMSNSV